MTTESGSLAKIRVPATSSNLGSAFDAVGLALDLHLNLEVKRLKEGPSRLVFRGQDSSLVPADQSNLIWRTMEEVAQSAGMNLPAFRLTIDNEIPIAKGLGSSAAAYLGAVSAADFLCGLQMNPGQILELCVEREGHPDNLAPALYGGLVASISGSRTQCARAQFPPEWTIIAVTPDFELETRAARAVLPRQVPYADAVHNVQRAAFLMTQILSRNKEGLREAMNDRLHQPYRQALIPGLEEILNIREIEGLIGVALSGAGSTVVAFADANQQDIGSSIREIFRVHGLTSTVRILKADIHGLQRSREGVEIDS